MACTGRCRHCSQGEHVGCFGHIDAERAVELIRKVCASYKIDSLMTFGGEPLLYPETVFKIQSAARKLGIPKRHIITNGYFSNDETKIRSVARGLFDSGVTKLMLSVDAFHQETIPLRYVQIFANEVLKTGAVIQTHPAWLVSREDENPYNLSTREILAEFAEMGIGRSDGNVIFPQGNALKYLGEYFDKNVKYENPYEDDPRDIHTVSVSADGSVLGGNIYEKSILKIIEEYK